MNPQSDMDFTQTMNVLQITDYPESWVNLWSVTQESFPDENIWFLEDAYIHELREVCGIPDEAFRTLVETVSQVRQDERLFRVAWHCQRLMFGPESETENVFIPSLQDYIGDKSGMFRFIVLAAGYRGMKQLYQRLGIPQEIMKTTLSDVSIWMNYHKRRFGQWGLPNLWVYHHFSGRLFRLGRLQFAMGKFQGHLHAYRHRHSDRVIALTNGAIPIRQDGQIDGTSGRYDENPWLTSLVENESFVQGMVISPSGYVRHNAVQLKFSEWMMVLQDGDPVLEIHIAEGEPLSHEGCKESLIAARQFFHTYFPESHFKALTCSSWLLDPQFQDLLPSTSNIVRFQQEFYLYPILNPGTSFYERIYGSDAIDLAKVPRQTHIQNAVFQHLKSGGLMRDAGGFMLYDIPSWGEQFYQTMERKF